MAKQQVNHADLDWGRVTQLTLLSLVAMVVLAVALYQLLALLVPSVRDNSDVRALCGVFGFFGVPPLLFIWLGLKSIKHRFTFTKQGGSTNTATGFAAQLYGLFYMGIGIVWLSGLWSLVIMGAVCPEPNTTICRALYIPTLPLQLLTALFSIFETKI
jgi:hypothetical protein